MRLQYTVKQKGLKEPISATSLEGDKARLGIYAKSQAALIQIKDLEVIDRETGEVVSTAFDPVQQRLERYALQSVVREILPSSRTAKCLRVPFRSQIDIYVSLSHQSAMYGGLSTCSSVWACPVCAAKISERRRLELRAAIAACEALGGAVALLTLTHPHNSADPLEALVAAETKALTGFFGNRQGRSLMAALCRFGQVRAYEVTHGRKRRINNGFHPHFHILLFLRFRHASLGEFERWGFEIWRNECVRAGLQPPSDRHGISLQDGAAAAEYVAKMGLESASVWGLDLEMTKGHTKRAKGGETPFDFLRACLVGEDLQARVLFREFAGVFKGKRQLVWSRGLREELGLGKPVSDAELAAVQEDDAYLLAQLSREQWRCVLNFDMRGELLELARYGNLDSINVFLNSL